MAASVSSFFSRLTGDTPDLPNEVPPLWAALPPIPDSPRSKADEAPIVSLPAINMEVLDRETSPSGGMAEVNKERDMVKNVTLPIDSEAGRTAVASRSPSMKMLPSNETRRRTTTTCAPDGDSDDCSDSDSDVSPTTARVMQAHAVAAAAVSRASASRGPNRVNFLPPPSDDDEDLGRKAVALRTGSFLARQQSQRRRHCVVDDYSSPLSSGSPNVQHRKKNGRPQTHPDTPDLSDDVIYKGPMDLKCEEIERRLSAAGFCCAHPFPSELVKETLARSFSRRQSEDRTVAPSHLQSLKRKTLLLETPLEIVSLTTRLSAELQRRTVA